MTFQDPPGHWSASGRNILDPGKLAALRECLERGPIIVEHWFFYGGCAPDRQVFDDYEEFETYLKSHSRPGDAFHVWEFASLCRDDNTIANGKFPDSEGRVPESGAY